jgi:predicted lactoylglutathione lyase
MESPMPKMIFVNLPVAGVEKSVAFYEAIGFIKDERFSQPGSAGAMTKFAIGYWSKGCTNAPGPIF